MPNKPQQSKKTERGSALLITLTMIVLITVVVLVFTVQTQLERKLSHTQFSDQRAQSFTQLGFDTALARIRETLRPFDDPFGGYNPTNPSTRPSTFWSLSPGRIDLFALTNGHARPLRVGRVALHTPYPITNTDTPPANLNAPDGFGHFPVWSSGRKMEVEWVTVGKNPSTAVSSTNPIEGRFAFWVDDEGSKINVNTADGSDNYTLSSYGQGTPTAVNLSVFRDLGDTNAPSRAQVRQIAAEARRSPFAAVSDLAKRSTLTNVLNPRFVATNASDLTTYSRSPDFNIFNLPKYQLVPSNILGVAQMTNAGAQQSSVFNAVDRRNQYFTQYGYYAIEPNLSSTPWHSASHLRSLYPTPQQLTGAWADMWPLMAACWQPPGVIGLSYYNLLAYSAQLPPGANFPLFQDGRVHIAMLIENYLVGRDGLNNTIRWPFLDANYMAKYNLRQLDSITLQIMELSRGAGEGVDGGFSNNGTGVPHTATIAPYGIFGNKSVMSAMGRYPRLTRVFSKIDLFPRPEVFPRTATGFYPGLQVYTNAATLPPGKNLGDLIPGTPGLYDGATFRMNCAISLYLPKYLYESDNFVGQVNLNADRSLPASMVGDGHALIDSTLFSSTNQEPIGWNNGGLNEADWSGMANSIPSYWMDSLIYAETSADGINFAPGNSSGIDFLGRSSFEDDPDPRAPSMRRPVYKSVTRGQGTNAVTRTGYFLWASGPDPNATRPVLDFRKDPYWKAGPVAGMHVNLGSRGESLTRVTRNLGSNIAKLRLKGGITLRLNQHGHAGMVAPLDAILGPLFAGGGGPGSTTPSTVTFNTWQSIVDWRVRATNAVIPLFRGTNGVEIALNQTLYVVAKTRDPMLGHLPGDWVTQIYTNNLNAAPVNSAIRRINSSWPDWDRNAYGHHGGLNRQIGTHDYLPEPEWADMAAEAGSMNVEVGQPAHQSVEDEMLFPYEENGVQKIDIARRPSSYSSGMRLLNISKQRSLPSIGQLQYVRTGAMPDRYAANLGDNDYAGMPFRCLNFGPANTQGGIPDWAMLDLFTVPNSIWTIPSSRFAYPRLTTWAGATRPELIQLTYGGASTGKINLNGSVLWPWAENESAYVRPMPLAAQFNGLRYNRDGIVRREEFAIPRNIGGKGVHGSAAWMGNVGGNVNMMAVRTDTNSWRVLQPTEAQRLAQTIAEYIRVNQPLALPGQMCDILPGANGIGVTSFGAQIPTTSTSTLSRLPPFQDGSLRPPGSDHFYTTNVHSGGINRTRNDIVNQSIGNLVTQGNVFAIWVVGQSIHKSSTSDPTRYEPDKGDKIAGETRLRFLVERKLDPGVDGVYGNSRPKSGTENLGPAGWDQTIGTPDDLVDADYHPRNPKFIYEVINVREIQ